MQLHRCDECAAALDDVTNGKKNLDLHLENSDCMHVCLPNEATPSTCSVVWKHSCNFLQVCHAQGAHREACAHTSLFALTWDVPLINQHACAFYAAIDAWERYLSFRHTLTKVSEVTGMAYKEKQTVNSIMRLTATSKHSYWKIALTAYTIKNLSHAPNRHSRTGGHHTFN